jgi:hypothetical protein
MKDTATRARERQEAEAKKMVREATIICSTMIVLGIIIIVAGLRI